MPLCTPHHVLGQPRCHRRTRECEVTVKNSTTDDTTASASWDQKLTHPTRLGKYRPNTGSRQYLVSELVWQLVMNERVSEGGI